MNIGPINQTTKVVVVMILMILISGLVGYGAFIYGQITGQEVGYNLGYQKAKADIEAKQQALEKKATEEAVNEANPFKAGDNPLEDVADPLEKTKNILNP